MAQHLEQSRISALPRVLKDTGLPHVHLKIGEGIVTSKNVLISTVLGSCVSVTMFNAATGLAGIFHAMLPVAANSRNSIPKEPCKFVDSAIELVYGQFVSRGVLSPQIEVKLFGGAFSMGGENCNPDARTLVDVGSKNVDTAKSMLEKLNLKVLREDVRGPRGRKLLFNTQTGDVWVKELGKSEFHITR